jgi:hypothetical protein
MYPSDVFGSHVTFIGPARVIGALQVEPPSVEETKPTKSRHVLVVQLVAE